MLRVTGLCAGNSPGPVNSPHKGPVTQKMFPFDDVIMNLFCFAFQVIIFIFTSFDLGYDPDCNADSLTLLDGVEPTSPVIGTYCGSEIPEPLASVKNSATLMFITDGSGNNRGFSVNFVATDSLDDGGGENPAPSGKCSARIFFHDMINIFIVPVSGLGLL